VWLGTRNREPKERGISGACRRRHRHRRRHRRRGRRFRFRRHISFLGVVFTNTRSFGSCASHFIGTANCYYEASKGTNDRKNHSNAL